MWFILKFIISVTDSHCDYSPLVPKNLAKSMVPIQGQINPITVLPPSLWKTDFNNILQLCVYIFQAVYSLQVFNKNFVFTFNTASTVYFIIK